MMISSIPVSGETAERREAAPLPLSFVVWLERQVLDGSLDPRRRIYRRHAPVPHICILAMGRWHGELSVAAPLFRLRSPGQGISNENHHSLYGLGCFCRRFPIPPSL